MNQAVTDAKQRPGFQSRNSGFFLHPSHSTSLRRLTPVLFSQIEKSLVNVEATGHSRQLLWANNGGKIMIHLIWYIVVGLIAGIIAKSVMHVHMTIFWTIVLGIIGSIVGGAVTHLFSPTTGRFHPAGIIFSTLGAILLLYVCLKLNIHFPRVIK
jgi:uncharacterized membrane protein YeaQ/YmgE (transglycosylase-associated protein family)